MYDYQQFAPHPVWSDWVDGERHLISGYPDVEMKDRFIRAAAAAGDCCLVLCEFGDDNF